MGCARIVFCSLAASVAIVAPACGSGATPDAPLADAGEAAAPYSPPPPPKGDAADAPPNTGPKLLSETGLYSDIAARTISPDLFAFAPRYEFWVDGGKKTRWLYLPPGTKIVTTEMDHWVFPVGTKAFKEFRYDGKLVETRLLMKVKAGTRTEAWWEAPYVWKEDGSDAVANLDGVPAALGTFHDVPSQTDCVNCHRNVSDVLIGVSAIQLSDPTTNALAALSAAGRLSTAAPTGLEAPGTGVVKDALAYLHGNCGHCHNDEAIKLDTQSKMRLRLLVGQTTPESTGAYTTTVGTVMRHKLPGGVTDVVVKGDPAKSGLWVVMGDRPLGMPPAGTQLVDTAGRDTIRQWIAGWQ